MASPLDEIPLDVLVALLEAAADPSDGGRARAEARARDAGFLLQCAGAPEEPPGVLVETLEATSADLVRAAEAPVVVFELSGACTVVTGLAGVSFGPAGEA